MASTTTKSDDPSTIADFLKSKTNVRPTVAIICGSGLGGLASCVQNTEVFKYEDIPGFPVSTVKGHAGELVFGELSGTQVVCMKGRFHSYEGYDMQKIAMPIRVFKFLGVDIMIVTNACGGLNPKLKVGDVMILSDHIFLPGLAGRHPLLGPNDESVGPRFTPLSDAYDPGLAHIAWNAGQKLDGLRPYLHAEGCYAMVSGPSYEASAESRYLRQVGADAVGMSTVPEVVAARHCGIRCLGFSLITNEVVLIPNTGVPANHAEVLEAANSRAQQMQVLVQNILTDLKDEQKVISETEQPPKKKIRMLDDVLADALKQIAELRQEVNELKAKVANS